MANLPSLTLEAREKGQLPLSIATSLAIESALGIMESDDPKYKKPSTPPILEYDVLWINLRTLFRNLFTSMERVEADKVHRSRFAEALHVECLSIQATIQQATKGACGVIFYAATHRSIASFYRNGQAKEDTTPLQKAYTSTEKEVIENLDRIHQATKDFHFVHVDVSLHNEYPNQHKRMLLMTHTPIDLVENKGFQEVTLLESHTGAIKKPSLWYTKLKGGDEMQRIPFDKATLQFFGDKGNMFVPYPKKYREVVLRCAEQNRWSQTTTRGRMLLTLELMRDPVVYSAFKELY